MARLRSYLPLLLIAVAALALRIAIIHELRPTCSPDAQKGLTGECFPLFGDTQYVTVQARYLADGHGFVDSNAILYGKAGPERPGAAHPPMFTIFLAALDKLGFDSVNWWRAATALAGSIGVFLIGLTAWRLAGDRIATTGPRSRVVGILAAAIAAIDPLLWSRDSDLLVESLVIPLVCIVVLAALRLWRRPAWTNAGLLGAAIGASWLTRAELVAWLPCMIPLFWGLRSPPVHGRDGPDEPGSGLDPRAGEPLALSKRAGKLAVTGAVAALLMAPWVLYNVGRFQHPVYISTNLGMAVLLGSCDATYYGAEFGYWTWECVDPVDTTKVQDDSESERMLSAAARSYIADHPGRAPVAALARAGRFWGIYQPVDTVRRWDGQEGMGTLAARASWLALVVAIPLAAVGGWHLTRKGVPISPLVAPVIVATLAAAVLIPIPRFRVAADVSIVILAAIGLDALWCRIRRRSHREPEIGSPRASG